MNSLYLNSLKREAKPTLIVMAVIGLILAVVLFLQSRVFNSSLWVLLSFAYGTWQEYLWRILEILIIWAGLTGVLFAIEFVSNPANTNLPRMLTSLANGFMTGFFFTYFLVFALGILIFIPLGFVSLFIKDIVEFATLEFAWLTAACIIFLWIALDTPTLLWEGMQHGRWYIKLLAALLMLELGLQVLEVLMSILKLVLESSRWITRWDADLLTIFGSLIVTLLANWFMLGPLPLRNRILPMVGVYLASVATGNLSQIIFHWGELPVALVAAFGGPILYTLTVGLIIHNGIVVVFNMVGAFVGMLIGLFVAQHSKLAIIGNGWFGILCGTSIAIGFGIAFGGLWAQILSGLLATKTRLKPEITRSASVGLFFGTILGMVLGGFIAR